jgi:hypothetical protein
MATVTEIDIYKAALDHSRQLSTLRFAILTVFMTVNGALFTAYYSTTVRYPLGLIAFAGFWLALVFLTCELALSFTMAMQNAVAREQVDETLRQKVFRHRHPVALWSIRLALPSIYLLAGAYWAEVRLDQPCTPPQVVSPGAASATAPHT